MHLITLFTLSLLPLINAASFIIHDKGYDKENRNGCFLQIDNICGCSETIDLDVYISDCSHLRLTGDIHGKACGGYWAFGPVQGGYRAHYYKGNKCGDACFLGDLKDGASC